MTLPRAPPITCGDRVACILDARLIGVAAEGQYERSSVRGHSGNEMRSATRYSVGVQPPGTERVGAARRPQSAGETDVKSGGGDRR